MVQIYHSDVVLPAMGKPVTAVVPKGTKIKKVKTMEPQHKPRQRLLAAITAIFFIILVISTFWRKESVEAYDKADWATVNKVDTLHSRIR
jgi:hypothetical protein